MSDVANRPGHIQFTSGNESYTGCMLRWFADVGGVNAFFRDSPGFLVVDIKPSADHGVLVLYTSVLTHEQMADLQEWGRQVDAFMSERAAMRDLAKVSANDSAAREEAENARLREIGRKCEANHRKAIEEKRKVRK